MYFLHFYLRGTCMNGFEIAHLKCKNFNTAECLNAVVSIGLSLTHEDEYIMAFEMREQLSILFYVDRCLMLQH